MTSTRIRSSLMVLLLLALAGAVPSGPVGTAVAAQHPTVEELLQKVDDLLRGASSRGTMTMRIRSTKWERELSMKVQSKGTDKTLIQILSPAKEKGTATLKVEKNIWHYLPKVDRTIKVPASMMSGAWMGSHFTNDDLVRESRFEKDYDCDFEELPEGSDGHYLIGCTPHDDAPVVWGRVEVSIRASDQLADEVRFLDERGNLKRTMKYEDIGDLGGKRLPRRVLVLPADKPGEFTEISYADMEFDVEIPDRTFSLQALRR
jgi:outer membrane lipoprotein-sorting protein